jgi:hypothetical protein
MMTTSEQGSLDQAVQLLAELEEDKRTAPPEFRLVTEAYVPCLRESIGRFRDGEIAGRELEAHLFQIRISYARDLQRLLPTEPRPTSRWIRTA